MVCEVPTSQETAVLGAETVNASASMTVIFTSSLALFPPPKLLSLTKKEKFKSLATEGKTSHVEDTPPPTTVDRQQIATSQP